MGIKKLTHGGKRKGSGAKLKYDEETKIISFRVPKSHRDKIKALVNNYLSKLFI